MNAKKRHTRSLLAALAATAGITTSAHAQNTWLLELVAESGDPAHNAGGATFNAFTNAYLHPNGQAITYAGITGAGTTSATNTGIWQGTRGSLTMLTREGDPAPTAGGVFSVLDIECLAAAGEGTFTATTLTPTGGGLWSGLGGSLAMIAARTQPAPGTVESFANLASTFGITTGNDNGRVAFQARVTGLGTADRVLYANYSGAATLLGREGSQVTGLPVGANFTDTFGDFMVLNNANYLAVDANYVGGGFAGLNSGGILLHDPVGTFSVIANKTDPAVGAGAGALLDDFNGLAMNDSNDVLFHGIIRLNAGIPITADNNSGVWLKKSGGPITKIVQEDEHPPGTPAGVEFAKFEEIFLSNTGVIAIVATVRDPLNGSVTLANDHGVWADFGAGLTLLAREGSPMPDNAGNVAGDIATLQIASMSPQGEILIQASLLLGTGTTPVIGATDRAVWRHGNQAADPMFIVLRKGDLAFDPSLAPQSVTGVTITKSFTFSILSGNGPIGRPRALNDIDRGGIKETVLSVTHTGGFGIYVPIPYATPLEVIAVGGIPAPGVAGALYQATLPFGVINNNANVAFRGNMRVGTGVTPVTFNDNDAIWAQDSSGVVTLTARQGGPAPGIQEGVSYEGLIIDPAINDNETVAYHAYLAGPGITASNRWGLWSGLPGATSLVARGGDVDTVAGMPAGATLSTLIGIPSLNNSDSIVSIATFLAGGVGGVNGLNDSAILKFSPAGSIIAREGDIAPGAGGVDVFDNFGSAALGTAFHNDAGWASFKGKLRNLAATEGVWVHDGATLMKYALGGEAAPGTVDDNYLHFGPPPLSDSGRIVFRATLQGTVTPGVDDEAIFFGPAGGSPTVLVRTGQTQASGIGPAGINAAATFMSLGQPNINDEGDIIFRAELTPGVGGVTAANNVGVWRYRAGSLKLVAREGQSAPNRWGLPSGGFWDDFGLIANGMPSIGEAGRILMVATLKVGGSITTANNTGLWVSDEDGPFRMLVRRGEVIVIPNLALGTLPVVVNGIYVPGYTSGLPNQQRPIGGDYAVFTITLNNGWAGTFINELH